MSTFGLFWCLERPYYYVFYFVFFTWFHKIVLYKPASTSQMASKAIKIEFEFYLSESVKNIQKILLGKVLDVMQ